MRYWDVSLLALGCFVAGASFAMLLVGLAS
jgi:hypothetical protein